MVSRLQEWGTEVCWICILDFSRTFMCAFVRHKKSFKPKEFYLSRIFNGKKNVPFSEKFPKLIVRRIFTTKLNPPEPMEAKIIDPNSVGVILRMVNKGLHSQNRRVFQPFRCLWSRDLIKFQFFLTPNDLIPRLNSEKF